MTSACWEIGKREKDRSHHDLLDIKHGKNEQLKTLIKRKNDTYTKLGNAPITNQRSDPTEKTRYTLTKVRRLTYSRTDDAVYAIVPMKSKGLFPRRNEWLMDLPKSCETDKTTKKENRNPRKMNKIEIQQRKKRQVRWTWEKIARRWERSQKGEDAFQGENDVKEIKWSGNRSNDCLHRNLALNPDGEQISWRNVK